MVSFFSFAIHLTPHTNSRPASWQYGMPSMWMGDPDGFSRVYEFTKDVQPVTCWKFREGLYSQFFRGETRFKLSSCFWMVHSIYNMYNIYNYLHHYMPTVQLRIWETVPVSNGGDHLIILYFVRIFFINLSWYIYIYTRRIFFFTQTIWFNIATINTHILFYLSWFMYLFFLLLDLLFRHDIKKGKECWRPLSKHHGHGDRGFTSFGCVSYKYAEGSKKTHTVAKPLRKWDHPKSMQFSVQ